MPDLTQVTQAALVDLHLDAVALCNTGANSRAHIILNKRKEKTSMPSTYEELLKSLNPEHAEVVSKHIAALEAAKDKTIGDLQTQVSELEKSKPAAAAAPGVEEDVMKSLPEEVRKKFDSMQTMIDTLVSKQAEELAISRFEKCKALPVEEAELKGVLKSASPAVVAILEKAAQALVEKTHTPAGVDAGGQFKATDADAHYETLEKSAKKLMGENEGMSFEQAFTKAIELDPVTYTKYAEGVK